MDYLDKSKEELIIKLKELQQAQNALTSLFNNVIAERNRAVADLILAFQEENFQTEEKGKRAAELIIANIELVFQNKEKEKRAAEFIVANKELMFQMAEKEKRATELGIIKGRSEEFQTINEELIQNNIELLLAKDHAEESDRLKTAFLQNMSHEIRTPMNAIMGFSTLLVKQYNNKPKLEKFSEIINQRCNDLLDIINDILDIAKIESGQLPINTEECKLDELFAELTSFFTEHQKRIDKQHIKFSMQAFCVPDENTIDIDKVKLKQIFINLIGNAFKFTDSGSIEGGCKYLRGQLMFYVSDTGIGIPKDKQEAVFERFTQLNQGTSRNIGGTGLGLSIVKGLVVLLGGTIALRSEQDKGSTFSFTIPYKTLQPRLHTPIASEEVHEYCFCNKTILIVEDDLYNAEFLKEILTSIGVNVLHTVYDKEAIHITQTQPLDLILMDIRLPDMDGYDVTRQIKLQKPKMKIIAQTAYASHDERKKAIHAGCNDYISKPTNQELLLTMISKQLSKQ
jgi:signal transduction histidine kinase